MHPFMCYIENHGAVHGTICSQYIEHAWYSDLTSRDIQLVFELADTLSMRYLAFAISSNNVNWEVLHVQDKQNNTTASVTIPSTYDGSVRFGIKLYDTPPTVGSILNVGFDYVVSGGIDLSTTNIKTVEMTCATEGATIKYTLDGTDPTEDSTDYIGQIEVEPPVTIKARGFKDDVIASDVATLIFDILSLPAPVLYLDKRGYIGFSNGDEYDELLGNATSNIIWHFTIAYTDGSTENHDLDNGDMEGWGMFDSIAVTKPCTISCYVSCDGFEDSDVSSINSPSNAVETPVISQNGNNITISCGTSGATIHYTMNEWTIPDEYSLVYSVPFEIAEDCTIKAIAYMDGYLPSEIATFNAIVHPIAIWIPSDMNIATTAISPALCYGNGKFIAIVYLHLSYSEDGINWTTLQNVFDYVVTDVCYGNGKFVAVGWDGVSSYSEDGINWTRVNTGVSENLQCVCYANDKFVAGGRLSYGAYSEDGINWTVIDNMGIGYSNNVDGICYGNGKFIAFDGNVTRYSYSEDGINWTRLEDDVINDFTVNAMCYGNDKFVAVAHPYFGLYSENGIEWSENGRVFEDTNYAVCYGDDKFVASGVDGKGEYSEDGINWVHIEGILPDTHNVRKICYGNGRFVAIGYSGESIISSYCIA